MSKPFENGKHMEVAIPAGRGTVFGNLELPDTTEALVVFVHGSGSSRHSKRNKYVAGLMAQSGLGTLLFDLFTEEEEALDAKTGKLRFDIPFLAQRVGLVTGWIKQNDDLNRFGMGYFGASTGAAAAIVAAAGMAAGVSAVVSRGGRADLADHYLGMIRCPTLLIVGGNDGVVIDLNMRALNQMKCEKEMVVVEGAGHLFEEPGKLQQVAELAIAWFKKYLL